MGELYEFDSFRVDAVRRVLLRDGKPVPMSNKAFDLLLILVRERERVLDKEELLDKIWPDTTVEESNLTVAMSGLRKALGEDPTDRRYVVTIPGRGYRFAANVRVVDQPDTESGKLSGAGTDTASRSGRRWQLVAGVAALFIVVGVIVYWRALSPPTLRVLNYTQITNDGADKTTVLTIGSIQPLSGVNYSFPSTTTRIPDGLC
jgi:DNA-binding winged helix-turn-helix (wHTH) protein